MTGPLKAPCPHGRYEEHPCIAGKWVSQLRLMRITDDERPLLSLCPGGTPLAEDTLVIVKEDALERIYQTIMNMPPLYPLNGSYEEPARGQAVAIFDALAITSKDTP